MSMFYLLKPNIITPAAKIWDAITHSNMKHIDHFMQKTATYLLNKTI